MTVSGPIAVVQRHVCRPPHGQPNWTPWICPDRWPEFVFRPVACRELGGRALRLWTRTWELPR